MGLFGNSSQNQKPEYLDQDFSGLFATYESLEEALENEIDTGSEDIKTITFDNGSSKYVVYVNGDSIAHVCGNDRPFTTRFQLSQELSPLSEYSGNSDIVSYGNFIELLEGESAKKNLTTLYRDNCLETAINLDDDLKEKGRSFKTTVAVMSYGDVEDAVKSWHFCEEDRIGFMRLVEEAKKHLHDLEDRLLKIPNVADEKLVLKDKSVFAETDEERALVDVSSRGGTVEEFLNLAEEGFSRRGLLEALTNLILEKIVSIENVDALYEAFPEIQKVEKTEDIEEPQEIKNILEPEEESQEEKDGGFVFEYEETPILEDIEKLMDILDVDEMLKHFIKDRAARNEELEEELTQLEKMITPLSENYAHHSSSYSSLKFDHEFESLVGDGKHGTIDDYPGAAETRSEANKFFSDLSNLEEKRRAINDERRYILSVLLVKIPFDDEIDLCRTVKETIEKKISTIDAVDDVAYYDPSTDNPTDENLSLDSFIDNVEKEADKSSIDESVNNVEEDAEISDENVEEPSETSDEENVGVDIDSPDRVDGAVSYYYLVNKFGFDPVELYKEDMKIKRDGGNPYAPRNTSYSKKIRETWLEYEESGKEIPDSHETFDAFHEFVDNLFEEPLGEEAPHEKI